MRPRIAIPRAAVALTLLSATLPALAQPPAAGPPGDGFGPGRGLAWMADRLELSDAQREELRAAFLEEDHTESWRALMEARRALDEQVRVAEFDEQAIRQAAAAVAAVEADLAVARARRGQKLREILTPEQLGQLDELRSERHQMRGPRGPHRHGRFGPRGQGPQ